MDDEEFPIAIRPAGTYRVEGQIVTVNLLLRRDGMAITNILLNGNKQDLPGLASRIVDAVKEAIHKL